MLKFFNKPWGVVVFILADKGIYKFLLVITRSELFFKWP